MSLVYLDTGPLKGLLDSNDQEHPQAIKLFEQLDAEQVTICCPYPAMLELHRLLMYRKPRRSDAAKKALNALALVAARFALVYVSNANRLEAFAALERYPDQKITLADATIAVMAQRAGAAVVTFDHHHFGLMGAVVYG